MQTIFNYIAGKSFSRVNEDAAAKQVVEDIKRRYGVSHEAMIPKLKGGHFRAKLTEEGVTVSNLSTLPFLPWAVFQEAVRILIRNGGHAKKGDAMKSKLGDEGLPLDSVEGHIAHVVYGKQLGDSVFRRITPVVCILIWAGICKDAPGELVLR